MEKSVFKKQMNGNLISIYNEKDIFNLDISGLFCNLLPHKTFAVKGEIYYGRKSSE